MAGWVNEQRDREEEDWWLSRWMVQLDWESSYPPPTTPKPTHPICYWKIKCLHRKHILLFSCLNVMRSLTLSILMISPSSHTCTDIYTYTNKYTFANSYTPTKMLTCTNKQTQSYCLTCFSSTGGQLQQAPCQVNILKPCALTAEGKAQCWKHTLKYKE